MLSFEMNDRKKIGLGLTGFGIFFSFLGVIFFFDKGLLGMGNILFVSGVSITIRLKSTMQFFMKRSNFKGTISFGIGFLILMFGWPILGMIIEAYGFIVLFRSLVLQGAIQENAGIHSRKKFQETVQTIGLGYVHTLVKRASIFMWSVTC
ncbi:vesicle transport protein GOT1-like isoform X2 [Vicia villosa]|uniref:vesicle transport protein GOT1-like isoform X2 n=1 Tax=Vicia villosa TaxID=3911 RepID=UPI00273C6C0B|nr:vesicle transport protein GOT1-like isoform X2 [Vicia villosa]